MRSVKTCILALLLASMASGCYPDEEPGGQTPLSLSGLRLPLSEVGVELEPIALQRWLTWAEGGFDGEPFDMGVDGNDFAFYLRLFDGLGAPISFQGRTMSLIEEQGQDHLVMDLEVSACVDCNFKLALYWREMDVQGQPIRVFYGHSDTFTIQQEGDLPDGIGGTVSERTTGRVRVMEGVSDPADFDGAWVAARDPEANVRLPHTWLRAGDAVPALLTGVPMQRDMTIELDPLADGRFYAPFASIWLDESEGEVLLP